MIHGAKTCILWFQGQAKIIHILASIFPDTKFKVKLIIINYFPWSKITFIQQHAPNSSATAIRNNEKNALMDHLVSQKKIHIVCQKVFLYLSRKKINALTNKCEEAKGWIVQYSKDLISSPFGVKKKAQNEIFKE